MNDEELGMYLNLCCEELLEKQENLQKQYQLGSYEKYWCDLEQKILQFKNQDTIFHEFRVMCLGSMSNQSETWMWAWANESFPEEVRKDSVELKNLKTTLGLDFFEIPVFECNDEMAYVLTAISCNHLDMMGTYRVPTQNGYIVLGVMDRLPLSEEPKN